ncbi:MAG: archaellin/type IV pilin N-terminal domain-containing protein [Candidatus Bathyarchaeia archaeon]
MKTKTLSGSRKGISPILATLLLIVIAVAAIVVTYAWIMSYMGTTAGRAGEELVMENVNFHDAKNVTITLRSTGTSDSKIVAIYVGTTATNLTKVNENNISPKLPQVIAAGSSMDFEVQMDSNWEAGTRYYFKVVTESGYSLPFNAKP